MKGQLWKFGVGLMLLFGISFGAVSAVQAAVVYVLPSGQDVYEGDSFVAEVHLDSEGARIREYGMQAVFPPDKLQVLEVFLGGPFPKHADISNEQGIITFTGETPDGFVGDELVAYIVFLAKEQGIASLRFQSESDISSVEKIEDIVEFLFLEGNYTILEKPQNLVDISSQSHRDPTQWYRGTTLRIRVGFTEGSEYSYMLSRDPLATVDEIPDRPEGKLLWFGEMEYAYLDSGIHYFHARECARQLELNEGCMWGAQQTFRFMIDRTGPEEFYPSVEKIDGKYAVVFATTDTLSGIDHYEIAELAPKRFFEIGNNKEIEEVENWLDEKSPYVLEDQRLSSHIFVRAVDVAGNTRVAEIAPSRKFGREDVWSLVLLALVVVIGSWVLIKRKAKPAIQP